MGDARLRATALTITAPDPRALARFYARLLGRPVTTEEGPAPGEPPEAGWAQIAAPEGSGEITLNFEYERRWNPPRWPAEPGAPIATQHLDIQVDDLDAAVRQAVEAGATPAPYQPQEDVRVFFDPVGHPFCLFR